MSLVEASFIIFGLVLLNIFFSTAEFSIATSRKSKLEQLVLSGNKNAQKVLDLTNSPSKFIAVIQISLNVIAIMSGIFGDKSFTPIFTDAFQWLGFSIILSQNLAIIAAVLFITSIFILFAELIPKKLAFSQPEKVACAIVKPLLFVLKLFSPLVWALSSLADFILSSFNISTTRDENMSFEEVSAIITQGAKTGLLEANEHHLINNVFSLTDRAVLSAMTQKSDVIFLDINDSRETINNKVLKHPHSRFLVCDSELDNLLGYIDSTSLLKNIIMKQDSSLSREKLKEDGLKPILTIPNSLTLLDVLDRFRETRQDIAAVINEFGTVLGIITLNDVLGTIMGNVVNSLTDTEMIVKRADNSWLIDGKTPIEDIKRLFNWDELPGNNYETMGGFIMYLMKCIPKKSQVVEFGGIKFEVVDIDGYRIDEVMATIITQ
jgi:CBS domain containing-hemolysin-like protein